MIHLQSANQVELTNISSLLQNGTILTDEQRSVLSEQYTAGLSSALPQFVETLKDQNYPTATITGVQPIFLGGKLIAAKKYATSEEEWAKIELEKIKNEIIGETIINYSRVLLLNSLLDTRNDVLAGIEQHKEQAEKLVEQGLIAQYHLLRAQVALAEAKRNLESTSGDIELATLALKNTLGIEDNESLTLTDHLHYSILLESTEDLHKKTLLQQPVLRMINKKEDAAEQNFNIARSSFLPQIAAFGKYEFFPEYLSTLEPKWAIGIQAKINLFSGFKDYMNLQKAEHLENEVAQIKENAIKKLICGSINLTPT